MEPRESDCGRFSSNADSENAIMRCELLASAAALEAGEDPAVVASQIRYTLRIMPTIVGQRQS